MPNEQRSSIPPEERIAPVRSEDLRRKAPGNLLCHKCNSDRMHISEGGNGQLFIFARIFFVVYRCHTCGTLSRHTRIGHLLRSFFGSAKKVSLNVLDRDGGPIESQSKDFKPIKRDSNPVFRQKASQTTPISNIIESEYDPESIVKEIRTGYTLSQRELLASRFEELAALIRPSFELKSNSLPQDSNGTKPSSEE